MVVIPNREPDVFAAISHPARRRMLDHPNRDRPLRERAYGTFPDEPAGRTRSNSASCSMLASLTEQRHGRERRYRLVPAQLRPVRDWMAYDERFWDEHQLGRPG